MAHIITTILVMTTIACGNAAQHPRYVYSVESIDVIASTTMRVPPEAAMVEATTRVVAALATGYDKDPRDLWSALAGLTVHMHDARLPYRDTGASGLYYSTGHTIHLHYTTDDRVLKTYMHELGHALMWELEATTGDYDHARRGIWDVVSDLCVDEKR